MKTATALASGLLALISTAAVTAFDPVLTNRTDKFTFIDIPTPAAGPCDMATGPDGAQYVQYFFAEKIARIDPDTNEVTDEYAIPFTGPKLPAPLQPLEGIALGACVLRAGKDGNLYAANGVRNQLAKLDLQTKQVSVFTPPGAARPLGNLQPFNDMWGADEGMYLDQTSANVVNLFDYNTHEFKTFPIPTPASFPLGMLTASDGALWFTELLGQKLGRLNHTSGEIQEFPLPVPALAGPAVMRVETGGRYIWFSGALSNSMGRFDIYSHEFKAYPNTAPPVDPVAVPSEDTVDRDGNVWFCTWTQNILHYINPATGQMTHIAIPEAQGKPFVYQPYALGIGIDYFGVGGKNRIYFTQTILNRVGYYDLD